MRLVKEYCCCAIPLLNAGIYITLTEQLVVSGAAGILALVTPPVVGASVPSFVPIVFAVLCFVAAAVQLFGFMGVIRESTIIFRRYTTLHLFITTAIFAFSAVFIGISASKHDSTTAKCVVTFFPVDPTATATALTGSDSEGKLLCNIFTWIGVGTMGALWVVLAIFQTYLFFVVSGYGSSQRADHSKYYALYSLNSYPGEGAHPSFLPPDHIGMQNMQREGDAWDTRDSMETIGFEKQNAYAQGQHYDTGSAMYPQRQPSNGGYPGAMNNMPPAPVRGYEDPYYSNNNQYAGHGGMHPAGESVHRQTTAPAPQQAHDINFDGSFFSSQR